MSKIAAWFKAMRLRTLPLSFSVILMGNALAYAFGDSYLMSSSYQQSNWNIFYLTLLTTLFLQILSNFANDYGDAQKGADDSGRIGPERAIQSGALSKQEMLVGIVVMALLSLISGIYLLLYSFDFQIHWIFFVFLIVGLGAIAAAIKYTVGKRAYGYSGLGDVFVFIFFGLVGVIGSFYLQSHRIDWILLFPAITMGCFSVAVLNLNNMRDRENDQKVGKSTLAVLLGFEGSKIYHFILFLLAYLAFPVPVLGSIEFDQWLIVVALLPIFIFHVFHITKVFSVEDPADYDPELKKIALSTFAFALICFLIVILA
ncbi:MAG: 1,4-dihydroxy-2-naphthoate octaprenyltransferase [Crocinitomicaceae bacterium]|nr:1,4-dihydroxy-2-naphthoate octaprenyltransferase [Crocinitomicaceae bacterium]